MAKLITHLLVFAIGAGVGVYWGVHNPTDAVRLSNLEQAKMEQAKQVLTVPVQPVTPSPTTP
jgi:hypothetical protein